MDAFTGRKREKQTSRLIRIGDVASKWIITLGGIGTIAAVLLVAVFLVWVVWPLFVPANTQPPTQAPVPWEERQPIRVAVDEYRHMGWAMFSDGTLTLFRLSDGQPLDTVRAFDPQVKLTAWSFSPGLAEAAFGFSDGSARLGRVGFTTEFLDPQALGDEARQMPIGELRTIEHKDQRGMVERLSDDQYRFTRLACKVQDPIETGSSSPVTLLDHSVSPTTTRLAVLHEDGSLFVEELRSRTNILTGETVVTVDKSAVPYEAPSGRGRPDYLKLSGLGDSVYAIWKDGHLLRYDVRNLRDCRLAESIDLTEDDAVITVVQFLLGKITLVVGDSHGNVSTWFPIRPEQADTIDGATLISPGLSHVGSGAAVETIAVSGRSRLFALGLENGQIMLLHATSRKRVAELHIDDGATIEQLIVTPKDDGLVCLTDDRWFNWSMNVGHPEVTLASMFVPVWYESAVAPAHVWQSTGGTDDFEEKFGLYPLVFGTIKATVYSLLFGVPIALMAAIYTSEFMNPKVKSRIKPTIEMMASLPSVVLGFLAALVVAPFVEDKVPTMLAAFFTVPLMFLVGAYCWQLLPQRITLRLTQWRFAAILLMIPLGLLLAWWTGPIVEKVLFAGNLKLWLDAGPTSERFGSGFGGWLLILTPLSAVAVPLIAGHFVNPLLRSAAVHWTRRTMALVDFAKFAMQLLATVAVAALLGFLLDAIGWDPRGGVMDTYVQRNALVVGFIMGFAIIPIIYTLAEDALSTVPEHLRSASLGAGATPWQTAIRIIVPTAMSGLFSAMMIGLGRAVGETMIVLMAAGNTPVMEWNIFNGFRTLSANIAVELPEAVKDSTHYRTLYLAALVLFLMTFVLNTLAEAVRQRFRKRAFQL